MKNITQQPEEHKKTPWSISDNKKIYICGMDPISEDSEVKVLELVFNEDFKKNINPDSNIIDQAIKEIILNYENNDRQRLVDVYLSLNEKDNINTLLELKLNDVRSNNTDSRD